MSTLVLGNMGTPLMWLGCGHLIFFNAILGLIEGWMLARWGKVRVAPAVAFMIAGNYASAWIGYGLLSLLRPFHADDLFPDPPLYHIGPMLALAATVSVVFTIVVEMPLCLFAVRKSSAPLSRRVWWAVLVQLITYAGLALLYIPASPMTVLTRCTRLKDAATIVPAMRAWVYYIDADGWVHRCRPSGAENSRVLEIGTDGLTFWHGEGLYANANADGTLDIMFTIKDNPRPVQSNVKGFVGEEDSTGTPLVPRSPATTWPLDLRPRVDRPDYYIAMPMPELGLEHRVWKDQDRQYSDRIFSLTLASPFSQWQAGYPTMLPGGLVIFEFGEQIMVMDGERRLAALARGRSPLVVMEGEPEPVPSAP